MDQKIETFIKNLKMQNPQGTITFEAGEEFSGVQIQIEPGTSFRFKAEDIIEGRVIFPAPVIDSRELGRKLFSLHTHAELCDPEEIVYREADVVNLLTSLGLPAPKFGE